MGKRKSSATLSEFCPFRNERKFFAVVKSIEHFHKYLYCRNFLLRTDHFALQWLLQFRDPKGQVARWFKDLQEYYFEMEHRVERSHRNADALSRRPCLNDCKHCLRMEIKHGEQQLRCTTVQKDQESDLDLHLISGWKETDRRCGKK